MAVGQEIQVIYYPIREDMARRAKEMNSFSGYIEGTATAEYRRCVDQAVEAEGAGAVPTDAERGKCILPKAQDAGWVYSTQCGGDRKTQGIDGTALAFGR